MCGVAYVVVKLRVANGYPVRSMNNVEETVVVVLVVVEVGREVARIDPDIG